MPTSPVAVSDDLLCPWCQNFGAKFAGYAPALGFTAEEIAALLDDANSLAYVLGVWYPAVSAFGAAATAYKNSLKSGNQAIPATPPPTLPVLPPPPAGATFKPGARDRLAAAVARMKKAPKFDDAIEADLDVATTSGGTQPTKPTFTGTALGGAVVRLDWVKNGWTGVRGRMRRKGDANWPNDLGVDLQSPLMDKTALMSANQPEIREFQLQYLDGDEPTGDWSDIVAVTVS